MAHIYHMDPSIFFAPFLQVWNSPNSALIILPVSIVAFIWEMNSKTPSKFIPVVCLALGMILYPLLTPLSSVPKTFPVPIVVLLLNGLVLGFIAWMVHKFVVKKLIDKFGGRDDPQPPVQPPKP